MAYASVVSLVQTLEQIRDGHEILYNKEQIECLLSKVSFLQTFLQDFSQKSSKEVKELEAQIRDAAYAAQNIIDSYISNQLLLMCECCVDRSYTIFCQELQGVIESFDSAKLQVMEFRNMGSKNLGPKNSFSAGSLRLASGVKNTMVGFVDDMLQIKDRLTGEPSYKLDVVSIVGMGGIGKTTLARNIYDDAFIVYHFYTRAWVTISQEYHLQEILLRLLESMRKLTGKRCEDSYEE
ncbi:Disease resistance protein RPP13 [Sesamum alatum]|uniref:Disease resistance protein RPP13 n=1 Tax=Sesamum alatum TaxID=300844 RepID=A0AAE1YUT3_9LAMI|nr:Disease resistance protein RPP13 [Sesamum alatum]